MSSDAGSRGLGEAGCFLLVAVSAFVPRLLWVTFVPTRPFSDFEALVRFAVAFTHSPIASGAEWSQFNAGLPLLLAAVLRIVPGDPAVVARYATAVWTGAAALIPLLLLRGVVSRRARLVASLLLALWPGHVFFSGVVAQDNWVLPPVVALVALAVRVWITRSAGYPAISALLYVLCLAIRQEMLLVMLPAALVAAGMFATAGRSWRRVAVWVLVTVSLVGCLVGLRGAATGRFALSTDFAPLSVLGTIVPGARLGWVSPEAYAQAVQPPVLRPGEILPRDGMRLAWREFLRRPGFHSVRMFALLVKPILRSDADDLYWSIGAEEALPPQLHAWGAGFAFEARESLIAAAATALILFLAVLGAAGPPLRAALGIIAIPVFLKILIHVVLVSPQARYHVPVTGLELLAIGLASEEAVRRERRLRFGIAAAAAAGIVSLGVVLGGSAEQYVLSHQEQPVYRFSLRAPGVASVLDCIMREGLLDELRPSEASMEFLNTDPAAGDRAEARCRLLGSDPASRLALEVRDNFPTGSLPGRVVQTVEVNGHLALRHDLAAEPWTGWSRVELGEIGRGAEEGVVVTLLAEHPDSSNRRGISSRTNLRLVSEVP